MEQDVHLYRPSLSPSQTDGSTRDVERDTHTMHGGENGKLIGNNLVRI